MTTEQLKAENQALTQKVVLLEQTLAEIRQRIALLREREETFRLLLDESSDPIFSFYPDGTYRYVNKAFAKGVGRAQNTINGFKIWDVFSQDEADKRFAVVKWVFANGQQREIEVRVPLPEGDHYYLTTVKPVFNEAGEVVSVICISKEITERKRMEDELRRLSTYDLLSGLFNRNFFETEVARLQNSRLYPISIIMVDMNHLKVVNDHYGHAAGDELIRTAAQVLRSAFRGEEIIARFGGDEFVVMLPETNEATLEQAVARLREAVARQNNPLFSLSIGAATGEKGCRLVDVMRLADDRMYQEKKGQRE